MHDGDRRVVERLRTAYAAPVFRCRRRAAELAQLTGLADRVGCSTSAARRRCSTVATSAHHLRRLLHEGRERVEELGTRAPSTTRWSNDSPSVSRGRTGRLSVEGDDAVDDPAHRQDRALRR